MIDTLSIASDLVAAGVAKPQAEAHARAIANAVARQHGDIATKDFVRSEINSLRSEMIGEIGSLRSDMTREIGSLRADMTREIGALRTGASGDTRNLRPVVPGKTGCPIEGMRLLRAEMRAMEIRLVHWIVGTTFTTFALLFFALHFVSW